MSSDPNSPVIVINKRMLSAVAIAVVAFGIGWFAGSRYPKWANESRVKALMETNAELADMVQVQKDARRAAESALARCEAKGR